MNSMNTNLKGKTVEMQDGTVGKVTGGFGAFHVTRGTVLFLDLPDGTSGRWDGMDVKRIVAAPTLMEVAEALVALEDGRYGKDLSFKESLAVITDKAKEAIARAKGGK